MESLVYYNIFFPGFIPETSFWTLFARKVIHLTISVEFGSRFCFDISRPVKEATFPACSLLLLKGKRLSWAAAWLFLKPGSLPSVCLESRELCAWPVCSCHILSQAVFSGLSLCFIMALLHWRSGVKGNRDRSGHRSQLQGEVPLSTGWQLRGEQRTWIRGLGGCSCSPALGGGLDMQGLKRVWNKGVWWLFAIQGLPVLGWQCSISWLQEAPNSSSRRSRGQEQAHLAASVHSTAIQKLPECVS